LNVNKPIRPFHLAFPIKNLKESELWYTDILGCIVGRQTDKWIDFDFFGHQIVGHLVKNIEQNQTNEVDEDDIPSRHFGIILTIEEWEKLSNQLKSKNIKFEIEPHTRFKNKSGEQYTMFIKDPSGNFLEFKAFKNDQNIFQR
tara:strand:- start:489 stop:917 length:429 start_codon:yes stop_codon:yes gene_type:complete